MVGILTKTKKNVKKKKKNDLNCSGKRFTTEKYKPRRTRTVHSCRLASLNDRFVDMSA